LAYKFAKQCRSLGTTLSRDFLALSVALSWPKVASALDWRLSTLDLRFAIRDRGLTTPRVADGTLSLVCECRQLWLDRLGDLIALDSCHASAFTRPTNYGDPPTPRFGSHQIWRYFYSNLIASYQIDCWMEGSRRRSYQARLLNKLQLIKYLNPAQGNTLSADVNEEFIPKTLLSAF